MRKNLVKALQELEQIIVGRCGIFTVCDASCDALSFLTGLFALVSIRNNLLAFHDITIHLLLY